MGFDINMPLCTFHTCSHSLSKIYNKPYSEYTMTALCDHWMALAARSQEVLLNKLHSYWIPKIVNLWFKSYLYYITKYVRLGHQKSTAKSIIYVFSVPQGSLLYLIYIKAKASPYEGNTLSFTDDAFLFMSNYNSDVNLQINNLLECFVASKLLLNANISKYILITQKRYILNPSKCNQYIYIYIYIWLVFYVHVCAQCWLNRPSDLQLKVVNRSYIYIPQQV